MSFKLQPRAKAARSVFLGRFFSAYLLVFPFLQLLS